MKQTLLLLLIVISSLGALAQNKKKANTATPPPKAVVEMPKANPMIYDTVFKSVKWRNIGPFRGGRSVTSSGVVGNPLTYYMGTAGGGLWKTSDAGVSWSNISDEYFKTGF